MRLNRIDAGHDMVNYEPRGGPPFQALSDPNLVKPTLDWTARQAYGLVKDGADQLVRACLRMEETSRLALRWLREEDERRTYYVS